MKPEKHEPVIERIRKCSESLGGQQKALAGYIAHNPSKAAFMNSVQLSEAAGVSNPTVIRLAVSLGYGGFPEFQDALQDQVRERIRSLERYQAGETEREETLFQRVLSLEFHVLNEMKRKLDEAQTERAVGLLDKSERVYVTGLLANTCLAEYVSYFLGILRPNVHLITHADRNVYNQIRHASKNDAALVYSFPRYPLASQSLAEYFRKKGTPVIGVTDSPLSPLAPISDILLEAPMKFLSFIDPCAGAFALSHCLLTALYLKHPGRMREELRMFEDFAQNRNMFLRKDIDIVDLV